MRFKCSECGQTYDSDADMAGKQVECGKCGKVFSVPFPDEAKAQEAAAPAAPRAPTPPPKDDKPEEAYAMTQT